VVSESDKNKYDNIYKYKIGRILLNSAYIPLLIYFGFLIYLGFNMYSSGVGSQTVSNLTGVYFPLMMVVMIAITLTLVMSGKIIMIRSIEDILGKTRFEITPLELKNTVNELKKSTKNSDLIKRRV
jgi:hypothetical protein